MRVWECDKCKAMIRSIKKPEGWYDIKFFRKAQSKGGESFGCNLCEKCALETFNAVAVWESENE